VKALQKIHLDTFWENILTGNNIVVAASGDVDHQQVVDLTNKAFGHLPAGDMPAMIFSAFTGSQVLIQDDRMKDTHVAIGFKGMYWQQDHYDAVNLLQALIGSYDHNVGGGVSSSPKLAQCLSEQGYTHKLTPFSFVYSHAGMFGVHIVAEPEWMLEVLMEVFKGYNQLANSLSQTQLDRARNKLKTELLMREFAGTEQRVDDIGEWLQSRNHLAKMRTLEERFAGLDAFTPTLLRQKIFDLVHDADPAIAASGNLTSFPDYNFIRAWTHWKRL